MTCKESFDYICKLQLSILNTARANFKIDSKVECNDVLIHWEECIKFTNDFIQNSLKFYNYHLRSLIDNINLKVNEDKISSACELLKDYFTFLKQIKRDVTILDNGEICDEIGIEEFSELNAIMDRKVNFSKVLEKFKKDSKFKFHFKDYIFAENKATVISINGLYILYYQLSTYFLNLDEQVTITSPLSLMDRLIPLMRDLRLFCNNELTQKNSKINQIEMKFNIMVVPNSNGEKFRLKFLKV